MTAQDFKLYLTNGITLSISMSNIEMGLKIILLLASIGYTISKWHELRKKK